MDWDSLYEDFGKQKEFFMTLVSNPTKESVVTNLSSSFTTQFLNPIELGQEAYEVGISELWYSDTYKRTDNIPIVPIAPGIKPRQTFFSHTENDNIITTYKRSESEWLIYKQNTKHVSTFISVINGFLQKEKAPVTVHNYSPGGTEHFTTVIENTDIRNRILEISPETARILGFEILIFPPGKYTSEKPQSEDEYNKLPADLPVKFKLWHWIKEPLIIAEPSHYDFNLLIDSIATSFETRGREVRIIPTRDNAILHIFIDEENFRFQLPKQINQLLELDESYEFSQAKQDIYLPLLLPVSPLAPVSPTPTILEVGSRHQVYVLTNIIENQYFGTTFLPILRVMSRKTITNTEVYSKFSPVYYLPLNCSNLSQIQIQIVDESFVVLDHHTTPTTIVLHFRPKH